MAIKILKINKKKGYAILFAIIIISAISVVTAGLLNASYKQKILSSLANDSQIAFYQADKGAECALYLDRVLDFSSFNYIKWRCGEVILIIEGDKGEYKINPETIIPQAPYFSIIIKKVESLTEIYSNGYNTSQTNPRVVQRSIYIEYVEE